MLVLQHGAIKRLVETGAVEVWSPQVEPEPALNVHHVVRRRAAGQSITRAKALNVRMSILQELTLAEAWAAGFKNRDEFYDWWRARWLTGPRMEPIDCWVASYEREDLDVPQFLALPIAGRRGDYTANATQSIDELESVDATEWAIAEDKRRQISAQQEKWLWRQQRRRHGRGGRAAA